MFFFMNYLTIKCIKTVYLFDFLIDFPFAPKTHIPIGIIVWKFECKIGHALNCVVGNCVFKQKN